VGEGRWIKTQFGRLRRSQRNEIHMPNAFLKSASSQQLRKHTEQIENGEK
jgi:hypothetical protein